MSSSDSDATWPGEGDGRSTREAPGGSNHPNSPKVSWSPVKVDGKEKRKKTGVCDDDEKFSISISDGAISISDGASTRNLNLSVRDSAEQVRRRIVEGTWRDYQPINLWPKLQERAAASVIVKRWKLHRRTNGPKTHVLKTVQE